MQSIEVEAARFGDILQLRYSLTGRIGELVLPPPSPPVRADNLWRTTCFEAFLRSELTGAYREFNFSPSGKWAAYQFAAYRDGMAQASLPVAPTIELQTDAGRLILEVALSLDLPEESYRLGLSAVIEEGGGRKSYWALSHRSGAPDFHHPACFAVRLPPAPRP